MIIDIYADTFRHWQDHSSDFTWGKKKRLSQRQTNMRVLRDVQKSRFSTDNPMRRLTETGTCTIAGELWLLLCAPFVSSRAFGLSSQLFDWTAQKSGDMHTAFMMLFFAIVCITHLPRKFPSAQSPSKTDFPNVLHFATHQSAASLLC